MNPYPVLREKDRNNNQVSSFIESLIFLKKSKPGFLGIPKEFIIGFSQFFNGESPKICHAGELYIGLDPEGKILACPARSDLFLGDAIKDSIEEVLRKKNNKEWRKVLSCKGCWLECTVGVSMLINNPLSESSELLNFVLSHSK